jgi:hypothetical protein
MKLIFLLLLLSNNVFADDFDEFSENSESSGESKFLELSGFFEFEQGINSTNTGSHRSGTRDTNYVLAIRRFRIDAAKTNDKGGFFSKIDLVNDQVNETEGIQVRELRFKYKLSENLDLSIGKQVSTWGVSDMLFINDLFPKNWVANFTGRDMEMLKETSDSVRLTSYLGSYTVDTVLTPKFTPDVTPTGCRFSVYDPNSQQLISNQASCTSNTSTVDNDADNSELAISLKKNVAGFDLALYGYHGLYKAPKGLEVKGGQLVGFHPRLAVYGASAEGQFGLGIFTFETGYYESKDDLSGKNALIENSMLKYLVGYRLDLTSKFSVGAQIYQEKMSNYSEYESAYGSVGYEYRKKEISSTYTVRLNYKTMQETLNFSLFTYIRPDDHDSFTKLEISKKVGNDLNLTVGSSVFTGEENYLNREFGMLKDDDNIYLRAKYSF